MLYLHIGLHKTGTTFLQKAVFPRWEGIKYLPLDKLEYLTRMDTSSTYLMSREGLSGQNWMHAPEREACIAALARMLPEARIIMSFRQHSGYIVSSYTQYLQHGGYLSFPEYFDIESDNGFMKREDFLFADKIDVVRREFCIQPFVILFSDIIGDLPGVLVSLEKFMGGKAPAPETIKVARHNKSVGYYPSKILRHLNRNARSELNPEGRWNLYHWRLRKWGLDPRSICQYRLGFLPSRPVISEEQKTAIDAYFAQDWERVVACCSRRASSG